MGKVRMRDPDTGELFQFEAGPGGANVREAMKAGLVQDLNAGQQLASGVAGMLPPLVGMAGGISGLTTGGPAGAIAGALGGGVLGAGGGDAIKGLAGVYDARSPGEALMDVAAAGAQQGMNEALGMPFAGAMKAGAAKAASPLMRYALQPKARSSSGKFLEDVALKFGVPVTQRTIPFLEKVSDAYKRGVERAIAVESGNPKGLRYSWNELRDLLATARAKAQVSDPISIASERALQQAQNVYKYKWEGKTMTPSDLQGIKRWSQKMADDLYEARAKMQNPGEPSPMETAYKMVADEAQKMLERIPRVHKLNQKVSEAISLQQAIWEASKRKAPTLVPGMIGGTAATMHHALDPATLLAGGAGFFGAQAAMSPNATSRVALLLNNPEFQQALFNASRQGPRALATPLEAALGQPPVRAIGEALLPGSQEPAK